MISDLVMTFLCFGICNTYYSINVFYCLWVGNSWFGTGLLSWLSGCQKYLGFISTFVSNIFALGVAMMVWFLIMSKLGRSRQPRIVEKFVDCVRFLKNNNNIRQQKYLRKRENVLTSK